MTKAFEQKAELYRYFAKDFNCDLSDKCLNEMFEYESTGNGDCSINVFNGKPNGYAVGKKWLDVMISMWRKDSKENEVNFCLIFDGIIKMPVSIDNKRFLLNAIDIRNTIKHHISKLPQEVKLEMLKKELNDLKEKYEPKPNDTRSP